MHGQVLHTLLAMHSACSAVASGGCRCSASSSDAPNHTSMYGAGFLLAGVWTPVSTTTNTHMSELAHACVLGCVTAVTLSPEECEAYLKVHRKVAAEWEVVRALPDNMICTRILPLLGLLTPLRRMCSGGDYTLRALGLEPQMLQQQAIAGAALMDVDPPAAAGVAAAEGAAAAAAGVMAGAGSSLAAGSGGAGAGAGAHVYGEPKECPVCFELVEQPVSGQ